MSGGVLSKFIGLVTFVYIGKLLAPERYAEFTLFMIVVSFLAVLVGFGLSSGMLRIIWDDKRVILTNSLAIVVAFSALMALILFACGNFFFSLLNPVYGFLTDYKLLIAIRIFTTTCIAVLSSYYVSIERPAQFVKVNIVSSAINLALLFSLTISETPYQGVDILWLVIAVQTAAGLISTAYGLFISREYLPPSLISISASISILKQTSVFLLKNLIGVLQTYAARIVLSVVATSYLLGVYSFYTTLLIQLSFLTGIFDKTYIPKIRNLLLSHESDLRKHAHGLVRKTAKIYAMVSIPLFILLGPVIYILFLYRENLIRFIQPDYLENLHLFYFMFFAWLLGNVRSFYEVWQYTQNQQVNKHIIFIHTIILPMLYFGSVFFFNLFGIYGIIINQILIYLLYLIYSLSCYKKFVLQPAGI
jgi:O-antigen/teichoic acid export membrane protein